MTKNKSDERRKQIIYDFYTSKYDEQAGSRISGIFAHWFFNDHDRDQKDQILNELNESYDSIDANTMSDSELIRFTERIVAKHNLLKQEVQKPDAPKVQKTQNRRLLRIWGSVAAVIIPLFFVGGIWLANRNLTSGKEFTDKYVVLNGEKQEAVLPDGTTVKLNSGSEMKVTLNDEIRSVVLSGESHFQVVKDANRAFSVKTNDLTVTVLGTEFNINAYPERETTIVTLVSGSVKVDLNDGRTFDLTPYHQLVYNKRLNEAQVKEVVNMTTAVGWLDGVMACESIDMYEILDAVEKQFNVDIEIDPAVQFTNMVYTIRFDRNDTIAGVLSALRELVGGFDYKITGNKILIVIQE